MVAIVITLAQLLVGRTGTGLPVRDDDDASSASDTMPAKRDDDREPCPRPSSGVIECTVVVDALMPNALAAAASSVA